MSFTFNTLKAVQAVAVLLKSAPNHTRNYTAVLKMLYMADRKCIMEIGAPLTGDRAIAMEKGPVLSETYNLICNRGGGYEDGQPLWSKYIRRAKQDSHAIELLGDPGDGELSDFEIELLESIAQENGSRRYGELIEETHMFPEWRESWDQSPNREIPLMSLLKALGIEDRYDDLIADQLQGAHIDDIIRA